MRIPIILAVGLRLPGTKLVKKMAIWLSDSPETRGKPSLTNFQFWLLKVGWGFENAHFQNRGGQDLATEKSNFLAYKLIYSCMSILIFHPSIRKHHKRAMYRHILFNILSSFVSRTVVLLGFYHVNCYFCPLICQFCTKTKIRKKNLKEII